MNKFVKSGIWFPLIKLAKKLKAGWLGAMRSSKVTVFPLIKLAKKLKVFCGPQTRGAVAS